MHDMDSRRSHRLRARLFEIASEQGGYFTAGQAQTCGYSRALLAHHAKSGRFIRVRQGLYRFREYPSSSREDVIAAWLAAGKETAVVSHESALDILGLSDVVPDIVHLTVPRSKRYRTGSAGAAVHTTTRRIGKSDVVVREGIRVTGPVRSIVDSAEAGTAPEQIVAAVRQALDRRITTGSKLLGAARARGGRVERLVRQALEERRQA
ncbi:type IV toxin-antitoxin system AbiEi family antitoxin domain-containing protein [Candidatus Binatus sp.]|uniref:type IV toxin-antitoxin system AbiEi family antitoxin domain-containing protein n=1 Tax=Candidatus Binatus sp. TaxID=2811406 RepID=UPI003CC5B072